MADLNLEVHDISVAENTQFSPLGQTIHQKQVTFFVGLHGPFVLRYAVADATAARIKADIKAQQDELLSIHELGV